MQVMHFIQLYVTKRCQLYDYGSTATNVAAYQQATPPSISDCYHALRSVPVHLVAGLHDGVIPPVNIQRHFEAMQAAGVDVTYREVSCVAYLLWETAVAVVVKWHDVRAPFCGWDALRHGLAL